ncbi:MAG: hypothetical protein IJ557_06565 [Bacteroidaceae bacterium]|nr:hypothetical protein [Bacteroidaceae bacterium]
MIELKTISVYENSKDKIGISGYHLPDLLDIIKTGDFGVKEKITNLRTLTGEHYKEFKRNFLPMFVGGGDFIYRKHEGLEHYSNILILDFDWKEEVAYQMRINTFKNYLIENADRLHLFAVWLSPGHGVKAAFIHDNTIPELHYDLYWTVADELFAEAHELFPDAEYDANCSDYTRACFLSYDPLIFINDSEELKPYHFEPVENGRHREEKPKVKRINTGRSSVFEHTEEEIRMNQAYQEDCTDKKLMNYLVKSFNKQNPDYYKDGNRHSELKRRAALYVKDGVLFDNAVWSLVGQFGEGTWANLENEHIKSLVASIYNIAREDFGSGRYEYLAMRQHYQAKIKGII